MSVFGDRLPQCLWGVYPERASFSNLRIDALYTKRLANGGGLVWL